MGMDVLNGSVHYFDLHNSRKMGKYFDGGTLALKDLKDLIIVVLVADVLDNWTSLWWALLCCITGKQTNE